MYKIKKKSWARPCREEEDFNTYIHAYIRTYIHRVNKGESIRAAPYPAVLCL